ncbi:MAG: thioredoxin-dependent thiol peroxidase [Bacteroidota bacterium]
MSNFIQVGSPAPTDTVLDHEGKEVSVKDYLGQKLILFFYPKANTPGCTKEACSLRDHYETFVEKGYAVVGVSPDNQKPIQNFINKQSLPYPLWSDKELVLIKGFGAWGEKSMYGKTYEGLLRSTFVIDEEGKVSHVVEKVITKAHAEQLLELLEPATA